MPRYYPVFLNLKGKKCAVVGAGQVAWRKITTLLEHGATVVVISPEACPEIQRMAEEGQIQLICRSYQPGDLQGVLLAIAATDDHRVNTQISEESRMRGILVNIVDNAGNSNFIAPAYFNRGDITIAISTAGSSPALARKLRSKLEKDFGAEYEALAVLINNVRTEIKKQGIKVDGDEWQDALDLDLLIGLIRNGQIEQAREALWVRLKPPKVL